MIFPGLQKQKASERRWNEIRSTEAGRFGRLASVALFRHITLSQMSPPLRRRILYQTFSEGCNLPLKPEGQSPLRWLQSPKKDLSKLVILCSDLKHLVAAAFWVSDAGNCSAPS